MMRLLVIVLSILLMAARMPIMTDVPWQVVEIPVRTTLLDIAFTDTTPSHGWIVGDKGTFLETSDSGITWQERVIAGSNPDYFLTSVSFNGSEGWIAGQPKVLLHTEDEGFNWTQILLSSKLPGEPLSVTALGPNQAELVTNVGAIYRTEDGGRNWRAQVEDAIGVVKNLSRNPENGDYLAVSSRGSYYYLYTPESQAWKPFQRESSRRIQNMGFGPHGIAWKLNQGAEITLSQDIATGEWERTLRPGLALSFGYLGAAYQDDNNLWVVGGGATVIHSPNGGQTWEQAQKLGNIPANFYVIKFSDPSKGFILGQNGALLRYTGNT